MSYFLQTEESMTILSICICRSAPTTTFGVLRSDHSIIKVRSRSFNMELPLMVNVNTQGPPQYIYHRFAFSLCLFLPLALLTMAKRKASTSEQNPKPPKKVNFVEEAVGSTNDKVCITFSFNLSPCSIPSQRRLVSQHTPATSPPSS